MLIRPMEASDLEDVAEIEKECFSLPWSKQAFTDAISDANALFLVAYEEEKAEVIGYIGMYLSAPEGEITNVAVRKKHRGNHYGQALVSAMKEAGKDRGIDRIVLEVRVSNAAAIRTYEKMGFVSLGIRKNFYDMPKEDASIMAWEGYEC